MKKKKERKGTFQERLANWITTPTGKLRSRISPASQEELRTAILNPVAWFKGVQTPDGYVTPWELTLYAASSMMAYASSGFTGKQDFLFKEWFHIKANHLSVAGVISSIWDAINDPILGSFMDRKKMGPKQWRWIIRISAITGNIFAVVKMLDGGLSETGHLVVLVALNCLQDIVGTMSGVSTQKMNAGISPYTQQRSRAQVWSSVGSSMGYPISAIPLALMGLQDVLNLNDYQIIVVGAAIMLPFNILASMLLSFVKQRVDFRYSGKPLNALPSDPDTENYILTKEEKEALKEKEIALEEQAKLQEEAVEKAKAAYKKAKAERKALLSQMPRRERREWKRAHPDNFRDKVARGEIALDPETGEPKLSILQSFEIVKYNKYFILNTIGNFITVFTPSVDQTLVYRYLVPKLHVGSKEITGELFLLLRDQIIGTPVTFTKPFARQLVNLCGGPLRVVQINSLFNVFAALIKFALGINKFWKLAIIMLLDSLCYVIGDMSGLAGNMLNYEMLDYVELKTGMRTEGVTNAVDGLFAKIVTNNIGTVTGNAFLQWTGYIGGYKESGEALPERFQKYMWPMFTLSAAFDNAVFFVLRSFLKHTPEDAKRVEEELIALRNATGQSAEPEKDEREEEMKE